jgi:low temperature requirement protein LtrA
VERYGLFTIIVLGETILSASLAIQSVAQEGNFNTDLASIIAGGLLILFSMWWLYFDQPRTDMLTSLGSAFVWGYSHLLIFASAAAVGAGLSVTVDQAFRHAKIGDEAAGATVAVPVFIYLFTVWALHQHPSTKNFSYPILFPLVSVLILLTPLSGQAVLLTGLLLTVLVIIKVASRYRMVARVYPYG